MILPNPPWGVKPPTDPNHPIDAPRVDEVAETRKASAAELVKAQTACLDPILLARIDALYTTHQANIRARRAAQDERQAASSPLPADADLETVTARAHRRDDLDRYLGILDGRVAESGRAFSEAIAEVRTDLYVAGETAGGVLRTLRNQERQTRTQIADLERQARDFELLRGSVESGLKAWNWPDNAPPVVEPEAVIVEPPPRRKRFGRG